MSGGNIKVVVRCRPLNSREKARGATPLIQMEGNKTIITKPATQGAKPTPEETKAFTFDQSYWSADVNDPEYADQIRVYNDLGKELLDHAFDGYNCCIFAYGQTGSGKSYSMVGYGEDKGIIPRTCSELFDRVQQNKTDCLDFRVEVSYIEIYNEKVKDLLNPSNKANLKVREHPVLGPYVQDLSRLAVGSFEDIDQLMDEGNKARTVAATQMNATSSRSHAVCTIFVTQRITDPATKQTAEKVARISLVDLAGSERANSTGATGARLKEGANINKSLTTLGKVIAGLAEQASSEPKKGSKKAKDASHIPFRDSVLTWLLKDSLGGNSKTCMIAAISPADYDETLSTLRYADQAKKIKTKAIVNEDPSARAMRELKDEVEALRQALMVYNPAEVQKITAKAKKTPAKSTPSTTTAKQPLAPESEVKPPVVFKDDSGNVKELTKDEMEEQLQTKEKLLGELGQSWDEKLENTERIQQIREETLKNLGITVEKSQVGLYTPNEIPYLNNQNEDPLMSECLMYNIKPGTTHVDRFVENGETASTRSDGAYVIRLSGENIEDGHCHFENTHDAVTLYPRENCTTMINGQCISEPRKLKSGYRIILGGCHVFRFNNPGEAKKERESIIISESISRPESRGAPSPIPSHGEGESSTLVSEVIDWNYALKEAKLSTSDGKLNSITDQDLDKIYDEISRVRHLRKRQSAGSDSLSRRTSSSSVRHSVYSSSSAFMDDDDYNTTDSNTTISSLIGDEVMYLDSKQAREYQHHRRKYEALRRLSHRISSGSTSLSATDTALAKKVIAKWKSRRNVALAQTILKNDIYVQQANRLASESNKPVFYQFAIIHQDGIISSSIMESNEYFKQKIDTDLYKKRRPFVAIQVLDYKNKSTYLWSIEKFVARLFHIQGIGSLHVSSKHLEGSDMFFNSVVPLHVPVGLAKISLRNLATQVVARSLLSVYCRGTGRLMGFLRVEITPIARSVRDPTPDDTSNLTTSERANPRNLLHIGQELWFDISILEMTGLDPNLFSHVHAQFRSSTFDRNDKKIHATSVKENEPDKESVVFNLYEELKFPVTEDLLDVIQNDEIVFEVYGKPELGYLDSLKMKNKQQGLDKNSIIPAKKTQDVVAVIQVCEMTPEGDYKPVPVLPGEDQSVFSLQQGQQRRLVLTLDQTTLDPELTLENIMEIKMNQVKLVDSKGKVLEEPAKDQTEVHLKLINNKRQSQTPDHKLRAECSWDSSLHDTILLNAVTQNTHRVLLNLCWSVHGKGPREIKFSKEIAVHIKDQNKATTMKKKRTASQNKRASLLNFFSKPNQIKNQVSCIYIVENHAEMYGIQAICKQDLPSRVLNAYYEPRQKMLNRDQVEFFRNRNLLNDRLDHMCDFIPSQVTPNLEAVVNLWMKKDEPIQEEQVNTPKFHRWIPRVHQILVNDRTVAKKGFLQRKNDSEGKELEKIWCVLVGNYMFMYDDQSEVNEIDVVHIRNVHKEDENAMKSKTFFTIDTLHTSHKLQAQDNATMLKWVDTIDKLSHYD